MSIAKPFTFTANTYAKASEVNADFDTVYAQVNTNISAIATNANDIDNLENNKADINGSSAQRFAVADPTTSADAVNKQTLFKQISNSLDLISGFTISKDSGSPNDTILVSAGSAYDSGRTVVLKKSSSTSKQNTSQSASTTYYIYVIGNDTGSSVDILISTSSSNPSLPAGYTKYRQIGNYYTDSSNKMVSPRYYGYNPTSDKNTSNILSDATGAVCPNYGAMVTGSLPYTAPSNGYVIFELVGGTVPATASIGGVQVGNVGSNGSVRVRHVVPIYKGQQLTLASSLGSSYYVFVGFCPMRGV